MNWILTSIFAVLFTIDALYYVWLLQLNGYFWLRSAKNLTLNMCFILCVVFFVLQSLSIIWISHFAAYTNLLFYACLMPFVFSKKKVPLKFTNRTKRWIVLLFVLAFVLGYFWLKYMSPIVLLPAVLLADTLLLPLNLVTNRYYLKKAQNKLKKMSCVVIVVTGSYGKTSVKNILQRFLSTKYKTECSPSSFNTPLGLAKFINSADPTDTVLILEAGAKKTGDIAKICRLFLPRHAIVTGVTSQHLSTFKTLKNIISTKGEVLSYLPCGGFCVLNADDKNSQSYFNIGKSTKLSVGKSGSDTKISDIYVTPNGTSFCLYFRQKKYNLFTPLLGSINAKNIAMAFCLATKLNCDIDLLIEQAKRLPFTPHRLEVIPVKNRFVLDDSYNANHVGVDGFLEVLSSFSGNKVVVTQGIVEQGKDSHKANYNLGVSLAKIATAVAVMGQNTSSLVQGAIDGGLDDKKLYIAKDLNDAVKNLQAYLTEGSVIAFQNDLPDNFKK